MVMAQGLQVFDADGKTILDTNDRITKIIGKITISNDGSLTDDKLSEGTFWYYMSNYVFTINSRDLLAFPNISLEGNTIRWTYPSGRQKVTVDLLYGVY